MDAKTHAELIQNYGMPANMKTDAELKAMSLEELEALDDEVITEQDKVSRMKDPRRFDNYSSYVRRIEDVIYKITG